MITSGGGPDRQFRVCSRRGLAAQGLFVGIVGTAPSGFRLRSRRASVRHCRCSESPMAPPRGVGKRAVSIQGPGSPFPTPAFPNTCVSRDRGCYRTPHREHTAVVGRDHVVRRAKRGSWTKVVPPSVECCGKRASAARRNGARQAPARASTLTHEPPGAACGRGTSRSCGRRGCRSRWRAPAWAQNPSRSRRLRSSLRARRTASAFSRARFSEGFS